MKQIIDSIDTDFLQSKISSSLEHMKTLSFHKAERKYNAEFMGQAIFGIDGEKIQDHYIPLYWFGNAVICEHQSWVNGEFKKVLGLAIGAFYEWMSNDGPEDSGWTWDHGSPDFTVIQTLNNNQLTCWGNIVEAIFQANHFGSHK